MRIFEVGTDQQTPFHHHPWEHEVFVLEGSAFVEGRDGKHSLQPGDVVFIKGDEAHHFINEGSQPFRFLCVIPKLEPGTAPPILVEKEASPPR